VLTETFQITKTFLI